MKFKLTVSDPYGGTSAAYVCVTVINSHTPPDASHARADVGVLWPPDHKMALIHILGLVNPNNDPVTIDYGYQDEPTNGLGDGDTPIDAIISGDSVQLRAERSGNGNGRVYTFAYTVNDGNGGTNYIVTTVPNNTSVVNKANTTTSVTSSPNPSVIGQIVTFTATVTPPTPCTPGGSVQFYDGAALLGTGTLNGLNPNSATFSTSSLTAGSHSITATYVGDSNFNPSTSSASTQNVNYTFIGFLPPIDNPPVLNQVKAGQVIPVKWQLKNSSGAIICDLRYLL